MGLALGALAGVLSGLQGLPAGLKAGTEADQHQQALDLHRQQLAQQQEANYADVAGPMLPSGMQGQVNPATGTARIRTSLVGPYFQASQQETTRNEAVNRSAAVSLAIGPMAAKNPGFKALQDALNSGADATQVAPIFESMRQHELSQQQREQGMQMVAPLYKALGIEMPAAT